MVFLFLAGIVTKRGRGIVVIETGTGEGGLWMTAEEGQERGRRMIETRGEDVQDPRTRTGETGRLRALLFPAPVSKASPMLCNEGTAAVGFIPLPGIAGTGRGQRRVMFASRRNHRVS